MNKYIYVMKTYRTWCKMKNVMLFKTPPGIAKCFLFQLKYYKPYDLYS